MGRQEGFPENVYVSGAFKAVVDSSSRDFSNFLHPPHVHNYFNFQFLNSSQYMLVIYWVLEIRTVTFLSSFKWAI